MKFRALHRMLAALVIGLATLPAIAQSDDAATNAKIDAAINNSYLATQFDAAESSLLDAAQNCGDCSASVKARAWMYVGIVRGSGKSDIAGASEAFGNAKGLDPSVQLDSDLASEETKSAFQNAVANPEIAALAAAPVPSEETIAEEEPIAEEPAPGPTGPGALPPPAGVPGDMICSPQGAPIGVNMPVPISCSSDAPVAEGFIKFLEPGASEWKKITLMDMDGLWQVEIPCKYTAEAGTFQFYVGVKNAAGEYVDQFGSKKSPASIEIVPGGAAPSFPGQEPVAACTAGGLASTDCPPDFPGCGNSEAVCGDLDWGAACKNSSQCKCGLMCEQGACATAPTCSSDAECSTGSCVDGYCSVLNSGGGGGGGEFKRSHLSLAVGMDFMPFGGDGLCIPGNNYDVLYGIQCYDEFGQRDFDAVGNVKSGFAPAQLRIKLGYDFAITRHITVGARVGIGLLNTHPRATIDIGGGQMVQETGYLPIHAAVRGSYIFTSLANAGIRPGLYLTGGLAEVNAKVTNGATSIYKVAGRTYFGGGGTFGYFFAPNMGVNLDVQLMVLISSATEGAETFTNVSYALHPALSFQYGF